MIRTVTLNTGFDETLVVTSPDAGGIAEILDRSMLPSGKGVNCARALRAFGVPVAAYGLVGADAHAEFSDALAAEGVVATFIPVSGRTRRNVTVRAVDGGIGTHYRAAGFVLEDDDAIERLIERLARDVQRGDIVSFHGSTPKGTSVDTWCRMAEMARERGATVLVDVHGEPLVRILGAGGAIVACKPNEQEMLELPGVVTFATSDRARAALHYMAARDVWLPMVSLGAQGLVFGYENAVWAAHLLAEQPRVGVGAGDACMAGLTAAMSYGERLPTELVRAAVAAAVAHVEGTAHCDLAARARAVASGVQFDRIADLV